MADQISILQSVENRARLGSNLAASLWKHDEQRARGLLLAVQNDINTGLQRVDEDQRTNTQTRMVFLKLRMDTVERIAKYDAETALAFLKATEPDLDLTKNQEIAEMTRSLEVRLANQIANENPDVALKLARKSLARGFSHELLPLLGLLNKKDKEKAQTLYKEMVAKLVSTGLKQYSEAFHFAQTLARLHKPSTAEDPGVWRTNQLFIDIAFQNGCDKTNEQDNEAVFLRRAGLAVTANGKSRPVTYGGIETLGVRAFRLSGRSGSYQEMEEMAQNGTVDEMLALAKNHPQTGTRDSMAGSDDGSGVRRYRPSAKDRYNFHNPSGNASRSDDST